MESINLKAARKKSIRIISIVLCLALIFTTIPAYAFAATDSEMATENIDFTETEKDAVSEENSLEDTLLLEEEANVENAVLEESTEDSTVFDLGNGEKMVVYHGQAVRYEDEDGNLTDYDPSLVELKDSRSENGKRLNEYKFENKQGDKKTYIPENLSEDTPVLMENGEYSIEMTPVDETVIEAAVLETDETLTPYEEIEEKEVTAVYSSEDGKYRYEYTSLNEGVKETIVLEEIPESNVFMFNLNVEGLIAELNEEENTILLKDEDSEEVQAVIEKPFMNDRSGEAYSEDLTYDITDGEEEGSYIITLTVSREYLDDEERLYPVTIDPTATWKGEDTFLDAYVISGTTYGDINFYDSGVKVMTAGKDADGHTHQTFIKFPNLKSTLGDKYIHTAYLTVYETAQSKADQTIKINRITENWSPSTITWNNKPTYASSAANNFTTTGETYASHKVGVTTMCRNFVNDTNNPNYGVVLRNTTSSPTYAEFFGSRTSATSYQPKLVITYYDKPTAVSDLSVARYSDSKYITSKYMKKGYKVYATWEGIESYNLADVQYKIIAGDDSTPDPTSVGTDGVDLTSYRSIGTVAASGTNIHVPYAGSIPSGKYRLYIRGKDAGGMYGTAKYTTFYVDGDTPSISVSISPSGTTSSNPSNNGQPTVTWSASDTYLDYVELSIDGEEKEISGNSYTLSEDDFASSGKHTITVTAWDKSGKNNSDSVDYYYENTESVVPYDFAVSESYGKRVVKWSLKNYDSENYVYDIHRSTVNGFTPTTSNRIASDIDAGLKYYADKVPLEENTYYYKIVVRAKDASSNIENQISEQTSISNTLTVNDFTENTGFKDYLAYYEFVIPTGTGYIEKSSGNLMYTQDDFSISNSQLAYGLSRTYNSKNSFTGMFGSGWTDSYHMELYLKIMLYMWFITMAAF